MKIGYARISTQEQKLDPQIDILTAFGCEKIYTDVASGSKSKRDGLDKAMEIMRENDIFVVVRLDRLGRSMKHLINTIIDLETRKIDFCSVQENIDTTTSMGKLLFNILASFASFEREIIRERIKDGLKAGRARGRFGGRKKCLEKEDVSTLIQLYKSGEVSVVKICDYLNICKSTLYNVLRENNQKINKIGH